MSKPFDLVVLGGGCAGLSLATKLAQLGNASALRTAVLEQRTEYTHDRTWCYFRNSQAPADSALQYAWPLMRIRSSAAEVVLNCKSAPYEMVHAGQFYSQARSVIAASTHIELHTGVSIDAAPEKHESLWHIKTGGGDVRARYVVDTRPAKLPCSGGAKLWQSFYGQEVECEAEVFDPNCADLMDFSAAQACGAGVAFPDAVCFVYVLPTSKKRALLEFTVFGPEPIRADALCELQASAVRQRFGIAKFSVLRSEHGILPMGIAPAVVNADPSYVRAGLTAGGARPSSGYAYARIQRWATACAQALECGRPPVGHAPDGPVMRAMDTLFLKLVRAYPQAAPDLFAALFASANTHSVIRFLSDRASLVDYARVAAALLPGPLLRAVVGQTKRSVAAPTLAQPG